MKYGGGTVPLPGKVKLEEGWVSQYSCIRKMNMYPHYYALGNGQTKWYGIYLTLANIQQLLEPMM